MPGFRSWSAVAKVFTAAFVLMLISFGICSVGSGFEGRGTNLQGLATTGGFTLFLLSVLLLFIAILMAIIRALTRKT